MSHSLSNVPRVHLSRKTDGDPGRRRNGLLPACEPCRKAKVKCDFSTAENNCSRCRKRQKIDSCIIIDAPMTQAKDSTPKPRKSKRSTTSPWRRETPSASPAFTETPKPLYISKQSPHGKSFDSPGYLGQTSFSSTIQRNSTSDPDGSIHTSGIEVSDIDPRSLDLAIRTLRKFPDETTSYFLFDGFCSATVSMLNFSQESMRYILQTFWSTFGNAMRSRDTKMLENMAKHLIRNGETDAAEGDDPKEWTDSMSGENMRWETIGLFFVTFCFAQVLVAESNLPTIDRYVSEKSKTHKMGEFKQAVEACMKLCEHSLNPVVCNLLYKNGLLETIIHGDSSLSVWRLHHELVAVVTALGLHCYQGTSTVNLRSEMIKRLSGSAFYHDKEIAMFTGRPPALSHRYYSCPLPLDVSDEALMAGGELLEQELKELDENGGNTKGLIQNATICRIAVYSAEISDKIMELFLGNENQFSVDRLNKLKATTKERFGQFPVLINSTKETIIASQTATLMWRLFWSKLDYLRINFLLERLSFERGHETKRKLLDVSREMIDLTISAWMQRDRSPDRAMGWAFSAMCYGMPAAGILCAHLLNQIRNPNDAECKLPVSETVQSLSLMISFLEWIKPTVGDYKMCRKMALLIRRVLDQLFEAPPIAPQLYNQHDYPTMGSSHMLPMNLNDDLDWLNNIDWGRGPYLDFELE